MCIAVPMTVVSVGSESATPYALVKRGERTERVDIGLVSTSLSPGDMLLVFRGIALRSIDAEEAERVNAALTCLSDVMAGEANDATIESGFADLLEHPGALPPHLAAQVGKKLPQTN